MPPDALCLNLKGFLGLFTLENSFLLHIVYYTCNAVLVLSVSGVVLYGFMLLRTWAKARNKRGKSGSSLDV